MLPAPVEHLDMVLKRFPAAGLWLRKISNNLQNLRFRQKLPSNKENFNDLILRILSKSSKCKFFGAYREC